MALKKHKKKKELKNTSTDEKEKVPVLEKVNEFYDRFDNPLKWKILTGLLVFGLLLSLINKVTPHSNTEETETDTDVVEISDENPFEELNKFISKMSIVTGSNDDKDAAITWLNDNKTKYQDSLHRSRKMLYLDMVSVTRGNFTEEAATSALEECNYDFNASALYWADVLGTTGLSDDEIKTELAVLQRYGGFTADEITYALKNKTGSYSDEEEKQSWQYVDALSNDSYSNGSNKDSTTVVELVNKWLNEAGYSKEQILYNLTTYCNYDYDIVNDALVEENVDWGLQAQRVLNRFEGTEMNDTCLEEFLRIINGYPSGESKWAIAQM